MADDVVYLPGWTRMTTRFVVLGAGLAALIAVTAAAMLAYIHGACPT